MPRAKATKAASKPLVIEKSKMLKAKASKVEKPKAKKPKLEVAKIEKANVGDNKADKSKTDNSKASKSKVDKPKVDTSKDQKNPDGDPQLAQYIKSEAAMVRKQHDRLAELPPKRGMRYVASNGRKLFDDYYVACSQRIPKRRDHPKLVAAVRLGRDTKELTDWYEGMAPTDIRPIAGVAEMDLFRGRKRKREDQGAKDMAIDLKQVRCIFRHSVVLNHKCTGTHTHVPTHQHTLAQYSPTRIHAHIL